MKDKKEPAEGTVCICMGRACASLHKFGGSVLARESSEREGHKVGRTRADRACRLCKKYESHSQCNEEASCEVIKEGEGRDLIYIVTSPWLLVRVE